MTSIDVSSLARILNDPSEAAKLASSEFDLLLQMGAVHMLDQLRDPAGMPFLMNAAAEHARPEIREAAFAVLMRLSAQDSTCADAMYLLALEYDHLPARQHILANDLRPCRSELKALLDWQSALDNDRSVDLEAVTTAFFSPLSPSLRERILASAARSPRFRRWGKLIGALDRGGVEGFKEVVFLFPTLTERERKIARDRLSTAALADQSARDAICSLFIYHEDLEAQKMSNNAGWLPDDATLRTLFLFLSGQNEALKDLDFDGSLLVGAYEAADKSLRRRLLAYSRRTGQVEWLRAVSRSADVRYLSDLGDADWESVLSRLNSSERYHDLWRLAQSAPPKWSAAILARLALSPWQPDSAAHRSMYEHLVPLAMACQNQSLELRPTHRFNAPSENITCLAVDPRHQLLAAGTTTQTIYLWELPHGSLHFPSLSGPTPVTRALSFSPDGEILAAAGGDQRIRLFKHASGQVIKTLEGHRGLVRSVVVHPNGRVLVSAGFDGALRSWRFPLGVEVRRMDTDVKENFTLAVLPENDIVVSAGAGWNISLWKLADGALLRRIPSGSDGILHLAAGQSSELVASAGRDRALSVWNALTGLLVRRFSLHPTPIIGLAFFPGDQILVTLGQDGRIFLWSLASSEPLAVLATGDSGANAMALSADGKTLVTASASGRLSVWDCSILLWTTRPQLPGRPLPLENLEDRLKSASLSPGEKHWLEFTAALWHWTRRYDIELGEPAPINFEDFDIQL